MIVFTNQVSISGTMIRRGQIIRAGSADYVFQKALEDVKTHEEAEAVLEGKGRTELRSKRLVLEHITGTPGDVFNNYLRPYNGPAVLGLNHLYEVEAPVIWGLMSSSPVSEPQIKILPLGAEAASRATPPGRIRMMQKAAGTVPKGTEGYYADLIESMTIDVDSSAVWKGRGGEDGLIDRG